MAKTYVLDRVAADLARGRTHPAIQRLGSLVAAHPTDLDLRRRLAEAYRRVGNLVQAGRWGYLSADADVDGTRAFERAYPSASARLRQLRWPAQAAQAATAFARRRLELLVAAAEAERAQRRPRSAGRRARTPAPVRMRDRAVVDLRAWIARLARARGLPAVLLVAAAAATLFFAGLGAVTVVQWIVQ